MTDKEFVLKAINTWRNADLTDFVLSDLETRVKKDKSTKLSVFHTALSAYQKDPINLSLRGPPGIGKTYNTIETLKYFPQENIWYLGGISRKSLIHDYGITLNAYGEEINLDNRPEKPRKKDFQNQEQYEQALETYREQAKEFKEELKNSYTLIDLFGKTLVFLDCPDLETFHMLYPILSHDKEEIPYKFVDRTSQGQLKTMKVVIRHWPASIFLTTNLAYVEEFSTRGFSATPEESKEKIARANVLTNLKVALPWKYEAETESFKIIHFLLERLQDQCLEQPIDVVVPYLNLYQLFPKEIVRDMRDFQHFTQFLTTMTLLHMFQRPSIEINGKKRLVATVEDVKKALDVYKAIFETTRTGTEKRILDFYHNIVKDRERWYLQQLTFEYNKTATKKLSERSISVMLEHLDEIGYVDIQKDTLDKRKNLYVPIQKDEKLQNPVESDSSADLDTKLEKGFEIWKKTIAALNPVFSSKKNSETKQGTWEEEPITLEEFSRLVKGEKIFSLSKMEDAAAIVSKEELKPKVENKLETNAGDETTRICNNSPSEKNSGMNIDIENQTTFFQHCYFCSKPIMTDNWVTDEFTAHKPAHPECYEKQRNARAN